MFRVGANNYSLDASIIELKKPPTGIDFAPVLRG